MAIIDFAAATSPSNVGMELFGAVVPHDAVKTGPKANAATDDSGSSVVKEEEEAGGTNPPHMALYVHNWELPAPPIRPEDASFTASVGHPMTSNPLPPQDGAESSVAQPPGQLEFERESSSVVTEARPAQHALCNEQPRIPNQSSPSSDTRLSVFLVKTTETSVPGILALNILTSTYVWIWREAAAPGEKSSSFLKLFIILATIAMFAVNVFASSKAKANEDNRSYLGVSSGYVIASFVWLVFLGGLMTKCMTRAAIWKIFLVAIAVILVMLAIWTRAFEHPKILRHIFCCFGRDRAAAQAPNDANARALQAAADADAHDEKV